MQYVQHMNTCLRSFRHSLLVCVCDCHMSGLARLGGLGMAGPCSYCVVILYWVGGGMTWVRGHDWSVWLLMSGLQNLVVAGIIGRWLVGYCMLGCKTWEKGRGWSVWILYIGGGMGGCVFGPADCTSKLMCYVVNNLLPFVLLCIVLVIHLVCSI